MKKSKRSAGILLHISSLPSRFGIGDFGPEAYKFADFLKSAGQSLWQVLPLTTVDGGCGNSPYSPTSAFAGNYLFISPELLVKDGFISSEELKKLELDYVFEFEKDQKRVNYEASREFKTKILKIAWENFKSKDLTKKKADFKKFRDDSKEWLEEFCLFTVIKASQNGAAWYDWCDELKFQNETAIQKIKNQYHDEIAFTEFCQYVFFDQELRLKKYLNELGIELVGDVPLYVTRDCADVWQHPKFFNLDENLEPVTIAGVPPDYFSATGQLWGNPTYNWNALKEKNFDWWLRRLENLLKLFDKIRIDHFRGLAAYWAVPAGELTAKNGKWVDVPYKEFFECVKNKFPEMPFWAENLGIITPDVEELRKKYELPGMLVLHFAFGNPADNPYAPHNQTRINVVYTGTHDNNTSRGWFENDATEKELENFSAYIGRDVLDGYIFTNEITRMALSSVANIAIVPMQDYLKLGADSRMNTPSTPSGNWAWRMSSETFSSTDEMAARIKKNCELYGRL